MRRFETRSEATLYLWDYFYVSNAPQPDDEAVWQRIERAVCRIRTVEAFLRPAVSNDEQLRNARQLLRTVRFLAGQLPLLKAEVAPWIAEVVVSLEADACAAIAALQTPGPTVHQQVTVADGLSAGEGLRPRGSGAGGRRGSPA